MFKRTGLRTLLVAPLVGSFALLAVSCGGDGASQKELEAANAQLVEKDKEIAALKAGAADVKAELEALKQTEGNDGLVTIIGVKAVPTPTPAPSPTPLPAGVTPPAPTPRPGPPASLYEPVPFTFYMETLTSSGVTKYGYAATVGCAQTSLFARGTRIVFRFEVFDTATAKRITGEDGATIKVKLPHGEELTARFSQRGGGRVPDAPFMWSAAWEIPMDYPVGPFEYSVLVQTKDGRSVNWKPPAIEREEGGSWVQIVPLT